MMKEDKYILRIKNLTKSFGGIKAVNSVNMDFWRRKITGLIGPNGAGKTTIFNLISGLIPPDEGEIYFEDKLISGKKPWEIAKIGIGRLFQDVRVFRKLTVMQNVMLGKLDHSGEFITNLFFRRKKVIMEDKITREEAKKWINFVGLTGYENVYAEDLSYGQQKLLSIARLLMGNYKLLLLDEPTAGVNPAMIKSLLELFKKMVKELGVTIIFIEHNMNVVLEIADWVFFLDEGKVSAFGRPDEILGDISVRKAYLGI